jgi:5-formyltetrahydrofolate cyclo-ligase
MAAAVDAKRALRREMRAVRAGVADAAGASAAIWASLVELPAVREAAVVMAYRSMPGEPDSEPFVAWCEAAGKTVVVPDARPDASPPDDIGSIDVVVLPGLAFTGEGDRLGQGGGWYDRMIGALRPGCVTIGVAFAVQIVDEIPSEPHDRRVDVVVSDQGIVRLFNSR